MGSCLAERHPVHVASEARCCFMKQFLWLANKFKKNQKSEASKSEKEPVSSGPKIGHRIARPCLIGLNMANEMTSLLPKAAPGLSPSHSRLSHLSVWLVEYFVRNLVALYDQL